jgi:hypothetical protein
MPRLRKSPATYRIPVYAFKAWTGKKFSPVFFIRFWGISCKFWIVRRTGMFAIQRFKDWDIQKYKFACCPVWVWNLVPHIKGNRTLKKISESNTDELTGGTENCITMGFIICIRHTTTAEWLNQEGREGRCKLQELGIGEMDSGYRWRKLNEGEHLGDPDAEDKIIFD